MKLKIFLILSLISMLNMSVQAGYGSLMVKGVNKIQPVKVSHNKKLLACAAIKAQNTNIQEDEMITLFEYIQTSRTYKNIVRGTQAIIVNFFTFLI